MQYHDYVLRFERNHLSKEDFEKQFVIPFAEKLTQKKVKNIDYFWLPGDQVLEFHYTCKEGILTSYWISDQYQVFLYGEVSGTPDYKVNEDEHDKLYQQMKGKTYRPIQIVETHDTEGKIRFTYKEKQNPTNETS